MILVTGATGTIGRALVRHLAGRGEPVRALTRDPSRTPVPSGAEAVYGDLDRPATLAAPAAGVSALFLLVPPGPSAPRRDLAMLEAARAARAAGVARVVKLSAIGAAPSDDAKVALWHGPGEEAVRTGGPAWTVLRPSDLATNTLRWAAAVRAGEPVPNPTGRGARGVVTPDDVAEAAAAALTGPSHASRTYTLTGPDLLSVPAQARVLGEVLGRTVTPEDVPPDRYRARLLAAGRDDAFAEVAVDGADFVRRGGAAVLTRDVQTLTGHPPRTFASWAEENRAAFA